MNFKKIIAAVAASALMLSTMAFSASAAADLGVRAMIQDAQVGWAVVNVDSTINGDGSYSVTIEPDAAYNAWGKVAFEAVDGAVASDEYLGATVTFDSVVVNGDTELPLAVSSYALCDDTGKVNINLLNVWYEQAGGNNLDVSEGVANLTPATSVQFLDADGNPIEISSWTINYTISGVGGSASPSTGNVSVYVLGSVMALAVVGVVASRKRK
ncbi:MAG: hypothetical protein LBL98_05015 [Ruminococcus sp.]|jgi:hypothetical protein|nr:hypothetical protein [Ruminococcus sp.]